MNGGGTGGKRGKKKKGEKQLEQWPRRSGGAPGPWDQGHYLWFWLGDLAAVVAVTPIGRGASAPQESKQQTRGPTPAMTLNIQTS